LTNVCLHLPVSRKASTSCSLPPSATALTLIGIDLDPRWLSQNTQLRRLELVADVSAAGQGAGSLGAALASLCQLTSLKIINSRGLDGLPQALQQMHALQRLRLDVVTPAPMLLPAGRWLAGLCRLAVETATLLASMPALQAAAGLQRLDVLHSNTAPSTAEVAEFQWQALCRWVESCPQLSRLDLVIEPGAAPLPMVFPRGLLDVQRRRPGLAVYSGTGDRDKRFCLKLFGNPDVDHDFKSAVAALA
jgi:hypothetical protein